MTNFLNGIEIIEVDKGGRTIQTPSTSVIGLIGTAFVDESISKKTIDEILPINKPIVFTNIQQLKELGLSDKGTIPAALRSIYNQASTLVIVVRIKEGKNQTETISNAAGDIANYTGIFALLNADNIVKYKPKILLCPYFCSITTDKNKPNAIVSSLNIVAEKLRAVAILDGPNTNREDAVDLAKNIGSSRTMLIDPSYTPSFSVEGIANVSSSSLLAGVLAKNDSQKGFWWSPSNTEVNGILSLNRPVSFALSDPTTDSNLLNAAGVTTIVFANGEYRIWGNRSPSKDTKWNFINVRRTVDAVYEALEQSMLWAMSKPITGNILDDIQNNVNSYLSSLVIRGALLGGNCWIDPEKNTPSQVKQGQVVVSFDLEPQAALEKLTFEAYRNDSYYETIFKN